jgi:dipeptidyl aminopeptidase/acylaminoacyl peptidase
MGLSPEQIIYDIASAGDPRVSPDGSRVLFTRSQAVRGRRVALSQVWICGIDGSNPRPVELDGERNSAPRWAPAGNAFSYVSNSDDGSALVCRAFDGGPARELTFHLTPIASPAWSPDGSAIAYTTAYDPENPQASKPGKDDAPRIRVVRRLDYKQDNRGYLNNDRQQVWIVEADGSGRRRLTDRPVDYLDPVWSPDGSQIAAKVPNRNGMHAQLAVIDVATGAERMVGPYDGNIGCWAWSVDGSRILIAADDVQTWQYDLFLYDLRSGNLTRLTDDLAVQPDSGFPTVIPPSQPVWVDHARAIFHGQRRGASELWEVDVETNSLTQLVRWNAQNAGLSADPASRYLLQTSTSLDHAGVLIRYDRTTNETTTLFDPNAAVDVQLSGEQLTIERGGYEIDIWLVHPDGFDPAQRYPVVLDIHGGPNSWYGFAPSNMDRALAGAGYLVAYSNPRGSGSCGREFTQQVIGDWGGEDYLDLMAVMDRVLELPYADASRTGVYGYSYGGFMASWIVGHTNRFDAAVAGAPVVDLVSFFGQADIGHDFGPLQIGGTPWSNEAEYRYRSPLTYMEAVETPVLILHGESDDRVPIGQGEQLFATLASMGKEVEFVRYPNGSHASVTRTGFPAHRTDYLERLIGWFDRWLATEV